MKDHAFELPWTPAFLHKHGGLVLSIGQFNQWVGSQLMASGLVQIWPGTPVSGPIFAESDSAKRGVAGLRLADQGVDKLGAPATASCPAWMCARASPSSAMALSALSAKSSTSASACPPAMRAASGRWA